MSFRNRLIISILLISTVPLMFVAYFSNRYTVLQSENDMIKYSTSMSQRSLNNFNALIKSVSDEVLEIVSSPEIGRFLRDYRSRNEDLNQYDNQTYSNQVDQINLKLFTIYSMNKDMISGIYLLDSMNKEPAAYSGEYKSLDFFQQVKALKGKQDWIIEKGKNTGNWVDIYLSSGVLNVTDDRILGIVSLCINNEYIQKMLIGEHQEKGEYSFILTQNNQIIAHDDERLIGQYYKGKALLDEVKNGKNGSKIMKIGDEKYIVTYVTSDQNGWKIIHIIPYNVITKKSVNITMTILYIALASMLAAILLSITLSFSMYRPVSRLSKAMNQVDKGKLDIWVPVDRKDEFGQLGDSFNKLMQRIKELIFQVEQEQLMKKEAEMSALRAQVNPHFLYNTLNVIKCLAKSNDMNNIEQVTVGLIDLLRISIGNNRDLISVEEEIKYVKSYIKIQRLRLDNEFEVIDQIGEELYHYTIPKFTLQPVIENAIIHGFDESLTGNVISLKGYFKDNNIIIEVSDNGRGMSENKRKDLQKYLNHPQQFRFNKVGIINVSERIKLQFGQNYGIEVVSFEGEGTKIIICLPAIPIDNNSAAI